MKVTPVPALPREHAVEDDVPEPRDTSVGSRLFKVAKPLIGAEQAAVVKAFANLIDSTPELARLVSLPSSEQTLANGKRPARDLQPRRAPRPLLVAAVFAAVFGLVVAGALGLISEIRDLRQAQLDLDHRTQQRASDLTAQVSKIEGEHAARKTQLETLEADVARVNKLAVANAHTTEVLTKHVLGRLEALGEVTGATRSDKWTTTPAELRLVAVQAELGERPDAG